MIDDRLYRPGIGIMLINHDGRIFVARRIDMVSEAWQMPQGGIDEGEDPSVALFREMREEIGTDKAEILAVSDDWYRYDLPADLRSRLWGGRYVGQRQKWYALRYLGSDADINIATEEPEFMDWKWAPSAQVPELIVPFKRPLYRELMGELMAKLPASLVLS
ncbi:MAG: RNA pyrophosphohydrolase [Alphaproteobacteria bacterium]|nr:RNA pyrophosphohydrolase [Alphaproteobacteria bacterium]MBU0798450.1 RNA pyrophosphohydrolase [Alphaproteobacteria bacterium]MBU0888408.1 RNA pyrophosphohydrolase [Alphaproteobacteria bacterium]MBU1814719.1 RNA pyrophosphohydrolase [Alphaproteobacteria bacterium]MBU2091354.1 RNA pyrophosphohydrolase [Alphaproteobacteria bacterium]